MVERGGCSLYKRIGAEKQCRIAISLSPTLFMMVVKEKSNLHHVVFTPKRVTCGEAHFRRLAHRQHRVKESEYCALFDRFGSRTSDLPPKQTAIFKFLRFRLKKSNNGKTCNVIEKKNIVSFLDWSNALTRLKKSIVKINIRSKPISY